MTLVERKWTLSLVCRETDGIVSAAWLDTRRVTGLYCGGRFRIEPEGEVYVALLGMGDRAKPTNALRRLVPVEVL